MAQYQAAYVYPPAAPPAEDPPVSTVCQASTPGGTLHGEADAEHQTASAVSQVWSFMPAPSTAGKKVGVIASAPVCRPLQHRAITSSSTTSTPMQRLGRRTMHSKRPGTIMVRGRGQCIDKLLQGSTEAARLFDLGACNHAEQQQQQQQWQQYWPQQQWAAYRCGAATLHACKLTGAR